MPSRRRSRSTNSIVPHGALRLTARVVLTDIEGTTSPIAFVKDELFPYADAHLDDYVAAHRNDTAVAEAMRDAALEAGVEGVDDAAVLVHLHRWIAEDRKATPLKTLQGLIWREGYEQTGLQGRVYPDAAEGLRRWHAAGVHLYVYSSGSIEAQRVLFAYSDQGDLTLLFRGYFDTTSGPKREAASYRSICAAIGEAPGAILFLSDIEAELDAAREAGLQTVRLLRPADTPEGGATAHPAVASFNELSVDVAG